VPLGLGPLRFPAAPALGWALPFVERRLADYPLGFAHWRGHCISRDTFRSLVPGGSLFGRLLHCVVPDLQ
jgi:hypothetical protein